MDGRGSPVSSDEAELLAAIPGVWDFESPSEFTSPLVQVPLLLPDGETDTNEGLLIDARMLANHPKPKNLAWFETNSRASAPNVNIGDRVIVDTADNAVTESGAFYCISQVGTFAVHQIFVEVDGTWTVIDAYRDTKQAISKEHQSKIPICGKVYYRYGPV
ncbi:hypothetical protein [Salinimonas marina]|nr:hypothetical protein [Salinimonas marina]